MLGRVRQLLPGGMGSLQVAWRDWRWLIEPEAADVIAFLSPDEAGWHRLRREAALLVRLAPTGVPAPDLIAENRALRLQIRTRVSGLVGREVERLCFGSRPLPDPAARYRPDCPLTSQGRRLAAELGSAVALMHRAVPVVEARRLGFGDRESEDWERVTAVLRVHAPDPDLLSALGHLRRWEACLPREVVLSHGDVHLFNVGVDASTGALMGVFDFDAACIAHPYEDLKFVFSSGYQFAARALRAYGETASREISLPLLKRFHLRAALAHFEHVAPGSGRFPQTLDWSRAAVRALAPEWRPHRTL